MRYFSQLTGEAVSGFDIPTDTYGRTYVVTDYGLIPEDTLEEAPDAAYEMFKERLARRTEQLLEEVGIENFDDPFKANSEVINLLTKMVKDLTPEDQADYIGIFLERPLQEEVGGNESESPTVTTPNGRMVPPNEDGTVAAPERSVVTHPSGGPDITLPDGGSVDKDGSISLPGSGSAEIGDSVVTMPEEGGTIAPNPDGSVVISGGAVVRDGEGSVTVLPGSGGVISSDGALILINTFNPQSGPGAAGVGGKTGGTNAMLWVVLSCAVILITIVLAGRKRKKGRRHRRWSEM